MILDSRGGLESFMKGPVWNQLVKSASRRYTRYVLLSRSLDNRFLNASLPRFLKVQLPRHGPHEFTAEIGTFFDQTVVLFPELAALVLNQHLNDSRKPAPWSQSEAFLKRNYRVDSIHDILLWAVINSVHEDDPHSVFVTPPSSPFRNAGGSCVIPFIPKNRSLIRSVTLRSRIANKHLSEAFVAAFGTCLNLASYSFLGGHQNTDDRVKTPTSVETDLLHPIKLGVNAGNDCKVLQKCLEVVSSSTLLSDSAAITDVSQFSDAILSHQPLVLFPLKIIYWLESTDSSRNSVTDNLKSAIEAAQVLLPLKFTYRAACKGMAGENVPGLEIHQQTLPKYRFKLKPKFVTGEAIPRLRVGLAATGGEAGEEAAGREAVDREPTT